DGRPAPGGGSGRARRTHRRTRDERPRERAGRPRHRSRLGGARAGGGRRDDRDPRRRRAAPGDRHPRALLRPEGRAAAVVPRFAFLAPHEADVPGVSPPRAVASDAFTDVSSLGKLEVRGGVPEGAIPVGPDRGLVVVDGDVREERDRLLEAGYRVYDMTAAL